MNPQYDVVIVGAGVVGSAIAFELSRYQVKVALIDRNNDVGMVTSKANSAILHTGFDDAPGSLESVLVRKGYERFHEWSGDLGLPIEKVGGLLVAWNAEELRELPALVEKAKKNRVNDISIVSTEEVYRREPNLGSGALGGIVIPGESITCTFTAPLAFATNAVINGVEWFGGTFLENVRRESFGCVLTTSKGEIRCGVLINVAGLFSDKVESMLGFHRFTITPRRGEFIVLDKHARKLVSHVILPVPTARTRGVLIAPTVYGNVLLGPTAEDIRDKTNTSTTESGLKAILQKANAIAPRLMDVPVISTYAGLRAASEHRDYQLYFEPDRSYICVGGLRSTGLTASLGIAGLVAERIKEFGIKMDEKATWRTQRMVNIAEAYERPSESDREIKLHPDFGKIVCYCERASLREVQLACEGVFPATSLEGVKRRTRAMMGRCQGFYCAAEIVTQCSRWMNRTPESLLALDQVAHT